MEYGYTVQISSGARYGIVTGDRRIVLIKAGLGGDCFGMKSSYLMMAHRLHAEYGCSVIVSPNPNDNQAHADDDKAVLEEYSKGAGLSECDILLFGYSNGAIKGLALTECGLSFGKIVLVNMPLMINYHKTKRYISGIPETPIIAVWGDRDPSASYVPFIKNRFENLSVREISGADHNFYGMTEEFVRLSELLFRDA